MKIDVVLLTKTENAVPTLKGGIPDRLGRARRAHEWKVSHTFFLTYFYNKFHLNLGSALRRKKTTSTRQSRQSKTLKKWFSCRRELNLEAFSKPEKP